MVKDMSTISLHFAVSGEATVVEDGHARVGNDVTDVDWVAEKKPEPGFTGKTPNPVARLSPASAAHHEAGSHPQPTSYSSFLDFEALEAQVGRLLAEVTAADEDAQRCQDLARSAAAVSSSDPPPYRVKGLGRWAPGRYISCAILSEGLGVLSGFGASLSTTTISFARYRMLLRRRRRA
jgi:hypothetical protein